MKNHLRMVLTQMPSSWCHFLRKPQTPLVTIQRRNKYNKSKRQQKLKPSGKPTKTRNNHASTRIAEKVIESSKKHSDKAMMPFPSNLNKLIETAVKPSMRRFPLYLFLFYVLQEDEISPLPFAIDRMVGPSMMPTIYTGDVYLRWRSLIPPLLQKYMFSDMNAPSNESNSHIGIFDELKSNTVESYSVGDVVVIKDYKGTFACKRIVGVEFDLVWKYGQYAIENYSSEPDFGIRKIHITDKMNNGRPQPPPLPLWENSVESKQVAPPVQTNEIKQILWTKVIVPKGHIWVEGDNPLCSIDSRHYGPLPLSNVRGKILYRLWPRVRTNDATIDNLERQKNHSIDDSTISSNPSNLSCIVSKYRPQL